MSSAATLTPEQLRAMGYVVHAGRAVRLAELTPPAPPPSERAWPVMRFELPRPISLASERRVEQGEVAKAFQKAGCKVENTSQSRPSKIAEGIPDLWVWAPTVAFWFEVKSGEDWAFSIKQLEWAGHCLRTGTLYGAGDRYSALVLLDKLGIGRGE